MPKQGDYIPESIFTEKDCFPEEISICTNCGKTKFFPEEMPVVKTGTIKTGYENYDKVIICFAICKNCGERHLVSEKPYDKDIFIKKCKDTLSAGAPALTEMAEEGNWC